MCIISRFIAFLLLLSLYASPLEAQVEGGVSGKAAIEEDASNGGPTAAAGKMRRILKKKKKKKKVCASKTKYLRSADEICGKTLDAPGWKYIISLPGKKKVVSCLKSGPTVTGDAILDCSHATILGKNTDIYVTYDGITVGGSAVLQNCAVSKFIGYGVVLDKTPGDKTVFNTRVHDNAYHGFIIEKEANNNNNKLVNIESNNNGYDGVRIKGDGDTTMVSPKVQGNGHYGIEIGGSGTNTFVNIESNNNGYDGVHIWGDGDNTIVSPKVQGNGYFGIDIGGSGTNKLTDVDIRENIRDGIKSSSSGITEVHGGVIKKNRHSGVMIIGGTTRIKEVVINNNDQYGVYLPYAGQTSIEGSVISKNILGGVKNGSPTISKISCSSIQSNGGFGVQMGAHTFGTTIMDTDILKNSVANIEKDDGTIAILVRVRACGGLTDDVIGFNVTELTSTTCDSTGCGYTCTECQHVVKTCI